MSRLSETHRICVKFVQAVKDNTPELLKKVKVHLILHLAQNMLDFEPTSSFNTERLAMSTFIVYMPVELHCFSRCETYNSLI